MLKHGPFSHYVYVKANLLTNTNMTGILKLIKTHSRRSIFFVYGNEGFGLVSETRVLCPFMNKTYDYVAIEILRMNKNIMHAF